MSDNGGTANSGVNSTTMTFTVDVTAVNDVPTYSIGSNQSVDEDVLAQTVPNWASDTWLVWGFHWHRAAFGPSCKCLCDRVFVNVLI